ncbi:MAG: site-specific integrase [Oscillospiraceae bacterium]|nr:site-specific integrase [Oscillospiraceae bacterium]
MAFAKARKKADGSTFYEIRAYCKEKKCHYTKYYYPPFGWSARAIKKQLQTEVEAFQVAVDAGEILSKEERKARDMAAAAEAALLKTLRQYAESVFMPTKEQSIAENTRLSYWSNLNEHILPCLGDTYMKDITPAMLSKLLLDFQKGHSHGSAVKVYNILNALFKMAYRDDTIKVNPMDKVDRPKQRKDDKAISEADKALFEDELLHVLDCVKSEPIKWQAFIYLAADTGARRGELCGLHWSDIDFKNGVVNIKRNLQYSKDKGVYEATPKGGRFRTVDIGEDTISILKQHQKEQASSRISKWVFAVDGEDDPMFPTTPTRYFKKFGEKYDIPGFHPHLLRHTSATLSLTNGGDPKSTADRLGHADAAVMLRNYAHANDESIRRAGQAARDALRKKKEQTEKEKAEA